MKPLLLLSLSLTAALGIPLSPNVKQSPVLTEGNLSPLLGDFVPAQGHVEVENPAPPPVLTPKKEQKPPSPQDQKVSENMVELEVKVKPEIQKKKELKAAEEEEAVKEPKEKLEGEIVELKLEVKPKATGAEKLEIEAETNVIKEEEAEIESEKEPEVESEPDFKVELEVKIDEASIIEPEDAEMDEKSEAAATEENQQEAETQSENEDDTDFKVESETKIELESQEKEEPEEELTSAQERFEVNMNLDKGSELMETAERHIDMERPQEALGHPFMESPEDDDRLEDEDDDTVLFEDQEDEELLMKKNNHLDGQQISEMEAEAVLGEELDVHPMFQHAPFPKNSLSEKKPFEESALKKPQTERRFCAGVPPDSKCYQFFKGPKTFKDAEYFCRQHFSGGHLASITSQFINQEVLKLILEQNGSYTRVWVGGYRLDRNHFIWMDGSMWSYADWLSGEPNNTSGVEDCLEVLGYFGSEPGKFNDFTCWTPQAFVCSYPYY